MHQMVVAAAEEAVLADWAASKLFCHMEMAEMALQQLALAVAEAAWRCSSG